MYTSIYDIAGGMSVEYVANANAWAHMVSAKKYVSKMKKKAGVVVCTWNTKRAPIVRRSKTVYVGMQVVDGISKPVYMKENALYGRI